MIFVGCEQLTQQESGLTHFYVAVRSIGFQVTKGNAPDTAQMNAKVRELMKAVGERDDVQEIFKLGDKTAIFKKIAKKV